MRSEVPGSSTRGKGQKSLRSRRALLSGAAVIAAGAISLAATTASGAHSRVATAVAASSNSSYGTAINGSLPAVGTPASGTGTITMSQLTGQTPTYIMPIIPGANSSTETFAMIGQLYTPLYYGPNGAKPEINLSLGLAKSAPVESNGGKTYTVHLKSGLKWSDGTPIDSQDIAFWYYIIKAALKASPANWGQYVPGEFPEDVTSIKTPNATTVVFNLNKSYNPGFFLYNQLQDTNGGVYALPATDWNVESAGGAHVTNWTNPKVAAKIYAYLNKEGAAVSSFGTNPLWKVVDGPYKLSSFSATNSSYVLTPNTTYGLSPKAVDTIDVNTYTSSEAVLNALESGSLDIGSLDAGTQLGSIPKLKGDGYSVFGGPSWGWFGGIINYQDTTDEFNKIILQPYMKAVFAELIDQPAIIKGVYHGWAVPAYGPIPSAPYSPYSSADSAKSPYPFDPSKAVAALKAHGWDVKPGGQTTCAKPGTASDECGAGITAGDPISFVWANVPESTASTGVLESEAFSSEAKSAAGITITLQTKTFNFLVSNYNLQNPASAKYVNDFAVNNYGGLFMDYYPTQDGVDNPGGGFNMGKYDDTTANKLINASVFSTNPSAVKTEAAYLTKNYPVFYMPDQDTIAVVSKKVGGSNAAFLMLTQQQWAGNLFYLNK